jgi:proteic killer suppression protein
MIKSFKCKATAKIFNRSRSKEFPPDIQQRAYMRLNQLNAVLVLEDLRIPPSNRFESLSGGRRGQYSIRINDQWRICFMWDDGPYNVEIVDYH